MLGFLTFAAFCAFAARRLLSYLHIYQQEDYDPQRLVRWMRLTSAIDKKLSLGLITLTALSFFMSAPLISIVLILLFGFFAYYEKNPLTQAKKPLVLTPRAKRMAVTAGICLLPLVVLIAVYADNPFWWLLTVQAVPFTLIAATKIMQPYETHVNAAFRADGIALLNKVDPYVIGITGSYGKTSVKHILGHILHYLAPTLYTPGSINTEMGIVRVIREQLRPHHKYFIVEMGAYGIGSIARLCRLTPPKIAVITAIGAAHFERFKTLNDTAKAKFEIAEAALAQNGKTIIHESVLEQSYAHQFYKDHHESFIVCGRTGDAKITDATQTKEGLTIALQWLGRDYTLKAPLYGLHQVGNIVLSFVVAAELGMPVDDIVTAVKSLPQIKHRLEVKPLGSSTIIDDAYNSNPAGFEAALQTLDLLGRDTRRILITPGMVEMGDKHDSEHARLGTIAAQSADIVLAVKADRIPTFVEALNANPSVTVLPVGSFAEAQTWLNANGKAGDVVLLENDLPDLYEKKLSL